MNERMQAYVGLIEQLLSCPRREETALLKANAGLVDEGLLLLMGQYADWLESQGNGNAGWLRGFAAQLEQAFNLVDSNQSSQFQGAGWGPGHAAAFALAVAAQLDQAFELEDESPSSQSQGDATAFAVSDRIQGERADNLEQQAYMGLIEQLLGCPQGEEAALLQANAGLVDEGLLLVMGQYADWLESQGNGNSGWLRGFAAQLEQAFNLVDESQSSQFQGDAAAFALEIMQLILQTQDDHSQVYEYFRIHVGQLDEALLRALPDLFARLIQQHEPSLIAAVFHDFGYLIKQFPLGNRMLNLELAIVAYWQALQVRTRETMPVEWATTMMHLAAIYGGRIQGDRADNIEQAITTNQQALTVMTREAMPVEWAQSMNNLANTYAKRIRGDRAYNLEQAITAYQQALTVITRKAMPVEWATTMMNLAVAYNNRIRGDRAQNIEEAITAHQQALTVNTREAMPVEWAQSMNNLAAAYTERIRGDRADNLEQAITAYQQALTVRTPKAMPIQWANSMNNLAAAYAGRIRGDRADNIEEAITAYHQALTVKTREAMPVEWAETMVNLGNIYSQRIRGDRADNIEEAITAYQQALTVITREAMPVGWAQSMMNLAVAYNNRIRGDRADNIEQAIAANEHVLEVYTRENFPTQWATTMNNLASAYNDRIRGDRAQNIEQAITAHQQALTVRTRENLPFDWAQSMMNLAVAYNDRIRGDRADNLEQAIAAHQQALTVITRENLPFDWAQLMMNLAVAYNNRIRGDRADNIEQAIAANEHVLEVYTRENFPTQWATTMNNLANAYAGRIRGDRAQNIEQAIIAHQQALTVRTRENLPVDWALSMTNLAVAYNNRIRGDRAQNIEEAIATHEQALEVFQPIVLPNDCRSNSGLLANLYSERQRWPEAVASYGQALQAAELLYQSATLLDSKSGELRDTADLPRRAAYALAQVGKLQEAVETLDQGRARGLSESLDRDRANLTPLQQTHPDLYGQYREIALQLRNLESQQRDLSTSDQRHSLTPTDLRDTATDLRAQLSQTLIQIRQVEGYADFLAPPSFEDVRAALRPECPLVYLVTTPNGSMALIVTVGGINVLWLDDLTETKLIDLLNQTWFAAYSQSQTNHQGWYEAIDTTTRQLWDTLMGPLVQKLQSLNLTQATFIPTGYLSLLPLHAAWTPDPTQPTGRRYVLDDLHITYAPNAQSLTAAQAIADRVHPDTIFAIDNPSQDLPNSEQEVQAAIASFLPQATILRHHRATTTAVKIALPQAAIAHFSCHGTANLNAPLNSGLSMSDGLLTLKDIFALNLAESGGLRLAILSACETGIIGTENADEAISLPTGLLQAGVAAVIASLWSVSDLSTMLLLTRFYHLWRQDGLEPAAALRAAQQWVRDTTNAEKAAYFKTALTAQPSVNTPGSTADFLYKQMLLSRPDQRDFAHPFHWAAFSYTGV